jgi:uncharacterized protein (DUF2236 family)
MSAPVLAEELLADDEVLLAHAGVDPSLSEREGLFRDDGWLRRVSREPAVLFGGGCALLLEVAHPLVAAGVAEHSDFRRDPFGRLQRTLTAITAMALEPRGKALAAARGVARAHERVRGRLDAAVGPFAAGTPYSGRDPDLVLWVWGTLVDTALAVYRDFVGPIGASALAEYHRDQRALALLLGAPADRTPGDAASFRDWFDGVVASEALTVGAAAHDIARAVLTGPGVARGPVPLITAALLPPRLRSDFGLAWDGDRERRYRALAAGVRALRPSAPVDAASEGG